MTTLGLVMIVRNAAADIERCLVAARPFISSWTICDTGSTDGTPEMIRAALDGHARDALLLERFGLGRVALG
jgi:glycosyltransferase involved in cell wall biosynthesis